MPDATNRFHLYDYLADETVDGTKQVVEEIPPTPAVNEERAVEFANLALLRVKAVCQAMATGDVVMSAAAFYGSMVAFHIFWKYRCGVPIPGTIDAWAAIYATGTEKMTEEMKKTWEEAVKAGMPSLDAVRATSPAPSPASTSENTAG